MTQGDVRLVWRGFSDLGRDDLYALLKLRCDVFIVEQRCPYGDIDGRDPDASHLLARLPDDDRLAGCLRMFAPTASPECVHLGRVASARFARGRGLGQAMIREALAESRRRYGAADIEIAAQAAVGSFYAALGFRRCSEDYDEDGIAHCTMRFRHP